MEVVVFFRVYDGWSDHRGARGSAHAYLRMEMPALLAPGDQIILGGTSLRVSHRTFTPGGDGMALSTDALWSGPMSLDDSQEEWPAPVEVVEMLRARYARAIAGEPEPDE